ncbi:MAG: hypothetical protein A6D92_01460 [Symbiobacterium thermophilum]|uniref:Stage 0 sporulation protein A homolog n=1 Tax=Symbiobacterium thermophilum TaxID=2734 RepID=A0A1Y2T8L8_SYMTR|nr:MAG: hypothetical protein A6D92_01460 [Symbiobacterium thermophilum]
MRQAGRVLVANPSLLERQRIASVLEAVGYEVVQAASLAEATQLLTEAAPRSVRAVLTETEFADGTVDDLIRQIPRDPAWVFTPVVVLGPAPPIPRLIELISLGASTVVNKPFSSQVLLRRLGESLAEAREREARGESPVRNLPDYLRREFRRADLGGFQVALMVVRLPDSVPEHRVPGFVETAARSLREYDLALRIGTRLVALVLAETGASGGEAVRRRLEALYPTPFSSGVAVYPDDATDPEELIRLARARAESALSAV